MKQVPLSKSAIKELNETIKEFNFSFDKKDNVVLVDDMYYVKDKEVCFFITEDRIIPSLKFIYQHELEIKEVIVDMGAVKFIAGGADVMRPGIVSFDDTIKKGDTVAVIDEQNKKPLVIAESVFGAEELQHQKGGKSLKSLHYIGDEIWNLEL